MEPPCSTAPHDIVELVVGHKVTAAAAVLPEAFNCTVLTSIEVTPWRVPGCWNRSVTRRLRRLDGSCGPTPPVWAGGLGDTQLGVTSSATARGAGGPSFKR